MSCNREEAGAMGPAASAHVASWCRRLLTIPLFVLACSALLVSLPLLLPLAAAVDLVRGRDLASARCLLLSVVYLSCEVVGIAACFGLWLVRGPWTGTDVAFYLRSNFILQRWWARTLYRGVERIFRMRIELDGADAVRAGPFILFLRHVSIGDTLLPAVFISDRHDLMLRYVFKRQLLWDPCLDIVGNRLPNCFVRRASEGQREIESVQRLADDLGPKDGVLIYPEGTRFTPRKRASILTRLAAGDDVNAYERAVALRHVLPPRLGGALGLLERATGVDAVFCAHIGFEGAGKFKDLLDGSLVRQRIRVHFWRVAADSIPKDAAGRAAWLYENWRRIDDWVDAQLRGDESAGRREVIERPEPGKRVWYDRSTGASSWDH